MGSSAMLVIAASSQSLVLESRLAATGSLLVLMRGILFSVRWVMFSVASALYESLALHVPKSKVNNDSAVTGLEDADAI